MDGWNTRFLLGWPIFRCYVTGSVPIGNDSQFDDCAYVFQMGWFNQTTTNQLFSWPIFGEIVPQKPIA